MNRHRICLFSMSYKIAPLEARERFALAGDGQRLALKELAAQTGPETLEAVILFTCNRLEFYLAASSPDEAEQTLNRFWLRFYGSDRAELVDVSRTLLDSAAVEHLMRVACSLDSMALGETQVLGQVVQALSKARSVGAAGPVLTRLFERAIHAGKRAREETEISLHGTSISHAAAVVIQGRVTRLEEATALIIGAGKMAELAALAMKSRGLGRIVCLSRTHANAKRLAEQVDGSVCSWNQLPDALIDADVVLTATGAPHSILHESNLYQVIEERRHRPLIIVDIAVPRDVDESVGALPGVTLLDIDDLQAVVDGNHAQRQAAVPDVEAIVQEEQIAYQEWLLARGMQPTIVELRAKVQRIAETELERSLNRLAQKSSIDEEIMVELAHRITRKILDQPTRVLREYAATNDGEIAANLVHELFGLDER